MCLAVPGKILEIDESADDPVTGRVATVDFRGSQVSASLAMTPEAGVGDYVLVHAGFAIAQLDANEARETWESIKEALGDTFELPGSPPQV
ncbi:MAG: HypC/HybG/HupF family hydrogenase formation chaperone [Planctomycetota bacterium]|jgi:hydrogenase expression/formation protein HypC